MPHPILRDLVQSHPFWHPELWFWPLDATRDVRHSWRDLVERVLANGSAEDLHAARDDYRDVIHAYLKITEALLVLADRTGEPVRRRGAVRDLADARDGLQAHFDSLFPRWQTLDDLEAILLEQFSVPADRLKTLAATHPPPRAWFDEDPIPPPVTQE